MKIKVPYYIHNINKKDITSLSKTLKELYLTTWETVALFEERFSSLTNNKYTVWVTSWTAALHLALHCVWINKDDEVISSCLTWPSLAILVEQMWGKNVFVDIDSSTWIINTDAIIKNITPKTKAVIVTHLYWQMYNTKKLKTLLQKYKQKIYIIEDSAHSIEWEIDGYKPWNYSDFACFSFQALKNITSVEWWAITTNNLEDYNRLKKLRYLGVDRSDWFDIQELWYKYNISNTQASLLLWQIEEKRLFSNLEKRDKIRKKYDKYFEKNNIDFVKHDIWKSALHLYIILLKDKKERDLVKNKLLSEFWIQSNINYYPINNLTYFKQKYSYKLPVTDSFWDRCLSIPLYPKLKNKDVEYICESIKEILKKILNK